MTKIAVLGAGKIGEALLSGLLSAGRSAADLLFTERYPQRAVELTETYGVQAADVATAAARSDVLVVAVKPQDIDPLLAELAPVLGDRMAQGGSEVLVVSLCAGLPTALFEARLPEKTAVVRVMPNTPMLVGEAMSVVSGGRYATEEQLDLVEELLGSVGRVRRAPETQQDAVTALSGSGPAYFFYLVEAMIDAGILVGIPRAMAAELIVQSAVGAATMLRGAEGHPVMLREAVTSPAGTTIAAIRELEKHGVRAALLDAIEAARDRSVELGRANDPSIEGDRTD
ncbi:pyrroline-5-carboxylate reductase [Actinoalloteichus hymeniacidonis]|uniref:Pyrroline-5-carboxylate reductase n=1 Tax=Actinoalloteichus hymeniacidonis TaxID=340345 RepID=A0AAC9HKX3_9PSEU|nr:pyrroline-5-carboxylate reductase [Actinoalloteichus hymeniacidonis]AOS61302.1 pyrroline-5-carboxylate reductase [Actinoalloteichus hymeniacidonis]MBB5910694.1 pyrroline-5-carboxylate reductase [Actinoalloteichus hymeniacidonis]